MKLVYIAIGSIAVALGIAGIFLPLLPTTPFLLVAAWAFARSSPRLETWLLNHPRLGPPLIAWRQKRAIPTRAKVIAILAMAASLAYMLWSPTIPAIGKAAAALVLAGSATFILTRPSG
ncbi:MAG: DUF454 domain-containing protein [Sphingomonadales bacterium]|nr:MAG: DUF454 domain-containing protein [Sphingomonadales bacterium]